MSLGGVSYKVIKTKSSEYKIIFDADLDFYSGNYNLNFHYDNQGKALIMELNSKKGLYIKACKWEYIDANNRLIQQLKDLGV